jgi:LuxR family maltose regulon positive regulatory protein
LYEARLAASCGRWEEAFERLGDAERLMVPNPLPPLRPHPAQRALWKLRSGDVSGAQAWVEQSGLSFDDDPGFVGEFSWLVWARVLMEEATSRDSSVSVGQAEQVLEKVLLAARKGERKGSILDALLALAQLRLVQEDQEAALAALREAVQLSAGEGFVQRFVEEGPRMVGLLGTLAFDEPLLAQHIARVIEVSGRGGAKSAENASFEVHVQPLVEPLSEREREVLALIAEGLSNKDISKRLFVAVSTVKGHNQNIFGKLAVKRRTEAVAKARKLGLL